MNEPQTTTTTATEHQAHWLCTRPRLAAILIAKGIDYQPRVNPWCPEMQAWEFTITAELLQVVADYYAAIDKPTPRALSRYYEGVQL